MFARFLALFQDSWNFVRNRADFTLYAILCLVILQTVISFIFPRTPIDLQASNVTPEMAQQMMLGSLLPNVFSLLAVVFVNVLLILNIKAINHGQYSHFFQSLGQSLQRFLPVTLLSFLQYLLLSLGVSFLIWSQGSFIAIPLAVTGLFVFIKLSLVIYVYLVESPQQSMKEAMKSTWGMSRGKIMPLVVFCALIYVIPMLFGTIAANVQLVFGDPIGSIIAQLVSAAVNLFVTIFSFRFYQMYRTYQEA